jgi:hypothetical protein
VKKFLYFWLFAFYYGHAVAASVIPAKLTGIWETNGSTFNGDAIISGNAIYLDSDGVGAGVAGNGSEILCVEFVVTKFESQENFLYVDIVQSGKTLFSKVLVYDPIGKILYFKEEKDKKYVMHTARSGPSQYRKTGLCSD